MVGAWLPGQVFRQPQGQAPRWPCEPSAAGGLSPLDLAVPEGPQRCTVSKGVSSAGQGRPESAPAAGDPWSGPSLCPCCLSGRRPAPCPPSTAAQGPPASCRAMLCVEKDLALRDRRASDETPGEGGGVSARVPGRVSLTVMSAWVFTLPQGALLADAPGPAPLELAGSFSGPVSRMDGGWEVRPPPSLRLPSQPGPGCRAWFLGG